MGAIIRVSGSNDCRSIIVETVTIIVDVDYVTNTVRVNIGRSVSSGCRIGATFFLFYVTPIIAIVIQIGVIADAIKVCVYPLGTIFRKRIHVARTRGRQTIIRHEVVQACDSVSYTHLPLPTIYSV